ncbi:sodium P-type ATPase [Aspergillus brunneoviolaceus CBS 621.78]|uniref:Sodium P-type ATPase n=1 Tax=Aspergillus brunneoviolaceus CBS 621.78 TaxID=1450534 RepID=A0ACD1G1M3_9EURO|nr:sodium P-type ATPase [Aspergillus brunneoviolaceus CBS 621.78]RAH43131.1 sodium P-type ATPase [Aspergillus brunneoviolaceus CBS 621.78]
MKSKSNNNSNSNSNSNTPGTRLSQPAHSLPWETILQELHVNPDQGLSSAEAAARLQQDGLNELEDDEGVSLLTIVLRQVANAMMLVLIIAMAVSFGIQSWIEGGVIAAVIGLNIVVGVYQDFAAEKTMGSLRSLSSPTGTVTRDGKTKTVPAKELVVGDVVELKVGDTVPADVRLIETMNLETDEALLTGESLPIAKTPHDTYAADTGPGDRLNIAYSSTTITRGRGRGIITSTGMATEIGLIAAALHASNHSARYKRRTPRTNPEDDSPKKREKVLNPLANFCLSTSAYVLNFLGLNTGTPLQRKLSALALVLFGIAVVFALVVMGANGMRNDREVIIYAVATGLAMIPACLVVVLTITMAAGTRSMVSRNVVVRRLESLEMLGAVQDVCSDKTGTLTQGKMVVKRAWVAGVGGLVVVGEGGDVLDPGNGDGVRLVSGPEVEAGGEKEKGANPEGDAQPWEARREGLLNAHGSGTLLQQYLDVAAMANLAHVHYSDESHEWQARGEPTDIAIQVFAMRFQWGRERWTGGRNPVWTQKAEYPFDSTVKKMSVIFENTETSAQMVFTKGAVERVLEACTQAVWTAGADATPLDEEKRQEILQKMEDLAKEGLRVLALACRPIEPRDETPAREEVEKDLTFCGLIGLYDPPRPETAGAIEECRRAGITVHMVTGDHPGTARAIAAQVGIIPRDMASVAQDVADAMVMTASQFDRLSDEQIDELPTLPLVIARCAPTTKVRMIDALHRRGRYAAMTGDGVNDSPSLKRADVGIAMGQSGSDVAKDASELVLTDDNFASIINGIEEGRRIFDNIQKFVLHLLAENVGLALTLLIGLAFKDENGQSVFPIAPVEILWIIMVTSGLPDMGLGMEVAAPDIMDRPPQNKQGIFTWEVIIDTLVYGVWMAALSLSAFSLVLFAWGDGNLATGCNSDYTSACDTVYRARATTFVCMTWFALFLAWEMVDLRRSFFSLPATASENHSQSNTKTFVSRLRGWLASLRRNRFLFTGIMIGFVTTFPILYIPVINDVVFKHIGISWEWGVVFVEAGLFFVGAEAWKWAKRVYFRRVAYKLRQDGKGGGGRGGLMEREEKRDFSRYTTMSREEGGGVVQKEVSMV